MDYLDDDENSDSSETSESDEVCNQNIENTALSLFEYIKGVCDNDLDKLFILDKCNFKDFIDLIEEYYEVNPELILSMD
jgi:hypothetical protein